MIKLAIFDLDGTLVNTIEDIADSVNIGLEKSGFKTHETEEYKYFVGNGVCELCYRALPDEAKNEANTKILLGMFAENYAKRYLNKSKVYDGIKPLIAELKSKGIKIAVASNKVHDFTNAIISKCFDDGTFDFVIGNTDKIPKKPEPDILNYIVDKLSVLKSETVMIGDSNIDVMTAKNAKVISIGCIWGFRTKEELIKAGADFTVDNPCEILDIIEKEI